MTVKLFSVVKLKDGTEGTIVEVLDGGEAYEFEPDAMAGIDACEPLTYAIHPEDIIEVIWAG